MSIEHYDNYDYGLYPHPSFRGIIIVITPLGEDFIVDFFNVLGPLAVTHLEPALA